MLDPTDPKSVDLMHAMLKTLSGQVWKSLKKLIGEALGASLEYPAAFLRITQEEGEQLYKHVLAAGATYRHDQPLYASSPELSFQRSRYCEKQPSTSLHSCQTRALQVFVQEQEVQNCIFGRDLICTACVALYAVARSVHNNHTDHSYRGTQVLRHSTLGQ